MQQDVQFLKKNDHHTIFKCFTYRRERVMKGEGISFAKLRERKDKTAHQAPLFTHPPKSPFFFLRFTK
jgi:hypothetical protein